MIARLRANAGFLVLAIFFFLAAWVIDGWDFFTENKSSVSYKFKKAIEHRDNQLQDILKDADIHFDTYTYKAFVDAYGDKFDNLYDKRQCGLFIFRNDSLVYWTDNSIPVEDNLYYSDYKNKIVNLKSGWYQSAYRERGPITFLVLGLIKHNFPYQNNYLSNSFQQSFDIPDEVEISLLPPSVSPAGQISKGDSYELIYPDEFKPAQTLRYISIAFYCLAIVLVLMFFERSYRQVRKNPFAILYAIGLMALVLLLRYIGFSARFPDNLYNLELFSPLLYAESETLPSLGDLLLTTLTVFYVVYLFSRYISLTRFKERLPIWLRFSISVILFLVIFLIAPFTFGILKGLVINSNISFNINNLFSLTAYSYVAFFIFGIILLGLFIFTDKLIGVVIYYNSKLKFGLGAFALAAGIYMLLFVSYSFDSLIYALFIFLISGIIIGNKSQHRIRYTFTSALFLVLLFGLFSTYIISSNTIQKEGLNRELMASRLAAENDPILEFLFTDVNNKIQRDSVLHSYLLPNSEAADKKQFKDLNQLYFNGYWEKYETKVTVFGADNCPLRVLNTSTHHDPNYFESLIREHGRPTVSDNFFFLDNSNGRISYLAKIKLNKNDGGVDYSGTLYLEFESKYNLEEVGYPELLLDRKVKAEVDLTDYSYSRYKYGKLVGQYGRYPYSLSSAVFGPLNQEYNWVESEGYTHLVDKTDVDTMVVLSRQKPGFLDVITPFSYFFFFYGLLALIYYIIATVNVRRQRSSRSWLFGTIDFKSRIQLTVIVMLMVSLIIIGVGTIYYVVNQSSYKNEEVISEKIHSISTELQNKIGGYDAIYPYMYDELSFSFSRMSNVFFSDINMYDLNGRLIASSRPVIFEEGLAGKNIDPYALRKLRMKQKTEYIHDENIGDLNYISAYVPFRNRNNVLLGYINLPYFAKQSELRKEITTVLVAIVNIYVLLIGISLIVAILISDRITRPLRLIQEKMGRLRLGKSYELIDYKANDEIGRLVAEYNRMIKELDVSAELLARSERESAWKEMAKQVAHEIKNPLTPMKLSVQQLQRTYKPNDPQWEAQLKRFTLSLIEQIDTLSRIAGEFATFARMPKTQAERVNLYEMLVNMQQLHANDTGAVITFKPETVPPCMVIADKEQLLRVFNNLIKNAIQAIPEDKEGLIVLGIVRSGNSFIATVADNGNGIPEDLHDKIFTPNFTTKTSGMGLGLAIVKSIVDSSGGSIWFETNEGEGSTFFVQIPLASN